MLLIISASAAGFGRKSGVEVDVEANGEVSIEAEINAVDSVYFSRSEREDLAERKGTGLHLLTPKLKK